MVIYTTSRHHSGSRCCVNLKIHKKLEFKLIVKYDRASVKWPLKNTFRSTVKACKVSVKERRYSHKGQSGV